MLAALSTNLFSCSDVVMQDLGRSEIVEPESTKNSSLVLWSRMKSLVVSWVGAVVVLTSPRTWAVTCLWV